MKRAADRARRSLGKFGGEIRPLSQSSIPALKSVCVRVRVRVGVMQKTFYTPTSGQTDGGMYQGSMLACGSARRRQTLRSHLKNIH
jgi:hypothetical protein